MGLRGKTRGYPAGIGMLRDDNFFGCIHQSDTIVCKHEVRVCKQLFPGLSSKQLFQYFVFSNVYSFVTHSSLYFRSSVTSPIYNAFVSCFCYFSNLERLCLVVTAASLSYNAFVYWLLLSLLSPLYFTMPLSTVYHCLYLYFFNLQ